MRICHYLLSEKYILKLRKIHFYTIVFAVMQWILSHTETDTNSGKWDTFAFYYYFMKLVPAYIEMLTGTCGRDLSEQKQTKGLKLTNTVLVVSRDYEHRHHEHWAQQRWKRTKFLISRQTRIRRKDCKLLLGKQI